MCDGCPSCGSSIVVIMQFDLFMLKQWPIIKFPIDLPRVSQGSDVYQWLARLVDGLGYRFYSLLPASFQEQFLAGFHYIFLIID